MKVFLTGSIAGHRPGTGQVPQDADQPLLHAASEIGYEAARAGHDVLVRNVGTQNTVDRYVLQGVARYCEEGTGNKARVEFHLPEFFSVNISSLNPRVEIIAFRYPKHGGPSSTEYHGTYFDFLAATVRAVERCDIAITLGDGESVRMVGSLSASGGTRVLAIATFGGSSSEVYSQNRSVYAISFSDPSIYSVLTDTWEEDAARRIVTLAERMVRRFTPMNKAHSYFISYSSADAIIADQIELMFRRNNRRVLRDETFLRVGQTLPDSIAAMVSQCDTFVAIGSSNYSHSDWCKNELALAAERFRPKRIVFLDTDGTSPPPQLASKLRIRASSRDEMMFAVARLIAEEPKCDDSGG